MAAEPTPVSLRMDAYATGDSAPEAPLTKIAFSSKIFYAFGDTIDGFSTNAVGFHLFFLTVVCGLPGALAGVSIFAALMLDALVDPLIGSISDNWRSPLGRRHPFLFASLIPIAIGLGLTYSVPRGLSIPMLFAYVTSVTILLRVSSVFTLPFYAMGAELTRDYVERSRLIVYRVALNNAAYLITITLGYLVFMAGDKGLLDRSGYMKFGWTIGGLLVITGLICAYGTLKERPRLGEATGMPGKLTPRLIGELLEVFRSRSFVVLFMTVLLFWVAQGVALQLAVHLAKFFWLLPNEILFWSNICIIAGGIVAIPIAGVLAGYVEKRSVVIGTLVFNCAYQGVLPLMRLLHLLPETGWGLYGILLVLIFLTGVSGAVSGIFFQSMMADAADEHEWLFGTRREGMYFAGITFSLKAAIAMGLLIGGFALTAIGFPQDVAAKGTLHLAAGVTTGLGIIGGILPALISTASLILLLFYRLDRASQTHIAAELAARRSG